MEVATLEHWYWLEVVPEIFRTSFCFFGEDGSYRAYMVTGADVEIGSHYEKVAAFKGWLRIYDDDGKTFEKSAAEINVYRSGDFGCIIQTL